MTFEALEEDVEVYGNAIASGDDEVDREVERLIFERLDRGDIYAWFCAKVTATWRGFEGTAYLGACSYENAEDFKPYIEKFGADPNQLTLPFESNDNTITS